MCIRDSLLRDVFIQTKQELFVFSVRRSLMKKPPVCLHDLIRTAVFVIKLFERLDAYLIKGTSRKLNDLSLIHIWFQLVRGHVRVR